MLIEAAWVISGVPGPLCAFFVRIRDKRGKQVAAVATARKLAVIVWHMLTKKQDYTWIRPALLQWKLRHLELATGQPSHRGGKHRLRDRFAISDLCFATGAPEPAHDRKISFASPSRR
ncbi:hypothetical protein G3A39_44910 [Paraburkholderia aspalathi]|nr:hypothetical protein [Paraburkholderia aspalathi]